MGTRRRLASLYFPRILERLRAPRYTRGNVSILMYHEVLPDADTHPFWHIVNESEFARQATYLQKHYKVISLDEAVHWLATNPDTKSFKKPLVVLTFDDGYSGNFTCAFPVLRTLNLPFTVYVATQYVETGGRFWYDDVAAALWQSPHSAREVPTSIGAIAFRMRSGTPSRKWQSIDDVLTQMKRLPIDECRSIALQLSAQVKTGLLRVMTPSELTNLASCPLATIGNHSHEHLLLDQVHPDKACESIENAQHLLTKWTGHRPIHFSYPNGNYNEQIANLVANMGFHSAVTTRPSLTRRTNDIYRLPRIPIGRFDNLNLFRASIAGLIAK